MRYYFFAPQSDHTDREIAHTAPVRDQQLAFLNTHVPNALSPLDMETYANGPLVILGTLARTSYVLDGDAVMWCAEWDPGLIIVRFSPSNGMAWAAFRDPRPEFGGRDPLPEDIAANLDEDDNPFYGLIFDAWDAQFEADHRKWIGAQPATDDEIARFSAAMELADNLPFDPGSLSHEAREVWFDAAKASIKEFAGEGLRYWKA